MTEWLLAGVEITEWTVRGWDREWAQHSALGDRGNSEVAGNAGGGYRHRRRHEMKGR